MAAAAGGAAVAAAAAEPARGGGALKVTAYVFLWCAAESQELGLGAAAARVCGAGGAEAAGARRPISAPPRPACQLTHPPIWIHCPARYAFNIVFNILNKSTLNIFPAPWFLATFQLSALLSCCGADVCGCQAWAEGWQSRAAGVQPWAAACGCGWACRWGA